MRIFICAFLYVHFCICIFIYVFYMCISICVFLYVHFCICIFISVILYTYFYMCIFLCIFYICISISVFLYVYFLYVYFYAKNRLEKLISTSVFLNLLTNRRVQARFKISLKLADDLLRKMSRIKTKNNLRNRFFLRMLKIHFLAISNHR